MNRFTTALFAAAAVLAAGCDGGPQLASVSGVVTLDGKPYPNAAVSFQPLASANNDSPGMGSTALTDENGRYTLTTIDGKKGAVVGNHKVRIQTRREGSTAPVDPTLGSADGTPDPKKRLPADPIPAGWYADGKEFTVPAGGTDKADFAIETVRPKK